MKLSELKGHLNLIQTRLHNGCWSPSCVIDPVMIGQNIDEPCKCTPMHLHKELKRLSERALKQALDGNKWEVEK